MKDFISLRILTLTLFSSLCISEVEFKMGLGSCNDQRLPTPAWSALEKEDLNTFFLDDHLFFQVYQLIN